MGKDIEFYFFFSSPSSTINRVVGGHKICNLLLLYGIVFVFMRPSSTTAMPFPNRDDGYGDEMKRRTLCHIGLVHFRSAFPLKKLGTNDRIGDLCCWFVAKLSILSLLAEEDVWNIVTGICICRTLVLFLRAKGTKTLYRKFIKYRGN